MNWEENLLMKTMGREGSKRPKPWDRTANAQLDDLGPLQVHPAAAERGVPGGRNESTLGMRRRLPQAPAM